MSRVLLKCAGLSSQHSRTVFLRLNASSLHPQRFRLLSSNSAVSSDAKTATASATPTDTKASSAVPEKPTAPSAILEPEQMPGLYKRAKKAWKEERKRVYQRAQLRTEFVHLFCFTEMALGGLAVGSAAIVLVGVDLVEYIDHLDTECKHCRVQPLLMSPRCCLG